MGLCLAVSASAQVIYETDFTTKTDGAPFNAGSLRFQDGWLGQNFTDIDPSGTGAVTTASTTAFPRNLNNRGALGGQAGGNGSGETSGPGFNVGDKLRVTAEYQFTLAGRTNAQLATLGVDEAFVTDSFNPAPRIGAQTFYSEFQSSSGGALKLFGSLARNGFSGADNPFALIVDGLAIGLDPDGTVGAADLESDLLEISIEMTYLGADEWQTSDLTLANSTTSTLLADAAADKPDILTETQMVPSENDLFMAVQWMRTAIPSSTFDSFRYEYTAAIPEPSSAVLALVAFAWRSCRRR